MMENKKVFVGVLLILAILVILYFMVYLSGLYTRVDLFLGKTAPQNTATVISPFIYNFNVSGALHEAGGMDESRSSYWWLDSGGVMNIKDNMGMTNMGEMPFISRWRVLYSVSNPTDTDNGYYPQNIFRLITRTEWQNFSEEAYFRIKKDNLSKSINRNISNGLLLLSRYQDGNNFYYTGIRVDGTAVIKKKKDGEYYTLAQKKIFDRSYNGTKTPNLLPKDSWIGIKSQITNNKDGSVTIDLFLDKNSDKNWQLELSAIDKGNINGGIIHSPGFAGIRTDFMDVEFRDFKIVAR